MRRSLQLAAASMVVVLTACVGRPTHVTTTWRDPAAGRTRFHKVAVFFVGDDANLRQRIEDRLASRIPSAVASHNLLFDEQLAAPDTQSIRSVLVASGCDGVVVLRLVSVETQSGGEATAPGSSPAGDLWDYLRRTPRSALTPGSGTVITMESRVYAVSDPRLLWAGHSQSFNPLSLKELVDRIVDSSADELRRQGLI